MVEVNVGLHPVVDRLNLPTVIKTAILPGDSSERLFIATQVGEIFSVGNGAVEVFLDIRRRVIALGASGGGYDERGLLGLAFHPGFRDNGLFYLHYSVAGTQGPGANPRSFKPDPCDPRSLALQWISRESQYDHVDTIEEWLFQPNGQPSRRRALLNLRRPFMNHNGVNSLNFSPETGRLVLTTGDGGAGYDPFNLSQNDMEMAGKIIEIDVDKNQSIDNALIVTRFYELPVPIQETLTIIAKGVRNISGISFQRYNRIYMKYIGNVGQDLAESIFAFTDYTPLPATQIIQASVENKPPDLEGFINFGWRGWEGTFPTAIMKGCTANPDFIEQATAYYNEAVEVSTQRLQPLISYFHMDPRPGKFGGTALTGVQPYLGSTIPGLKGKVVFIDFVRKGASPLPARGVMAFTDTGASCKLNDFRIIETDYDFGSQAAYYVSLGTNLDQTRLFLGVYGSSNVTDYNLGTIFEIVP